MRGKPNEVFKQTFKKGIVVEKIDVMADVKKSKKIEIINQGKMSDGDEFVTVKIYV